MTEINIDENIYCIFFHLILIVYFLQSNLANTSGFYNDNSTSSAAFCVNRSNIVLFNSESV